MPTTRNTPADKPVPVKNVLKKILGHKQGTVHRWVLSTKASRALEAVHLKTNIDKGTLADAAIMAIHAALSGSSSPIKIRDANLRAWLNRAQTDKEQH
jgi:hypothetical protein